MFHYAVFAKKKWKDWKEKISSFHKDYMIGDLEQNEIDTIISQNVDTLNIAFTKILTPIVQDI